MRRLALAALWLLAACSPVALEAPAVTASPTLISPTASPEQAADPASPTPEVLLGRLAIAAPGPDSQVLSPIDLLAELPPDASGLLRVELTGQDGQLLTRLLLPFEAGRLEQHVYFEVRQAQAGRLTLSLKDEFGRTSQAHSVTLRLLPEGQAAIQPAGEPSPVLIESPPAGAEIAEDQVHVEGLVSGSSSRPLTVQLLDRDGRVLATQDIYAEATDESGFGRFEADFDINIRGESWVLVTVSRSGGEPPGLWFLDSVEVLLLP